jgi:hypothetical protein
MLQSSAKKESQVVINGQLIETKQDWEQFVHPLYSECYEVVQFSGGQSTCRCCIEMFFYSCFTYALGIAHALLG